MREIEEIDELDTGRLEHTYSLSKEQARKCRLLIQLRNTNLSYTIYESERKKFIYFQSLYLQNVRNDHTLLRELKPAFSSEEKLHLPYQSVFISIFNPKATLVPAPLFERDNVGLHLRWNNEIGEQDVCDYDEISACGSMLEYALPGELRDFLHHYFREPAIFHAFTALIQGILGEESNREGKKCLIHTQDALMTVLFLDDGRLRFMNTYKFRAKEDFLYYLLQVCEQLQIDRKSHEFIILGETIRESALYELVSRYVGQLRFGERPGGYYYHRMIKEMPAQFNFILFSLIRCGL